MPQADRHSFKLSELLEMMIKSADVHEGEWELIVNHMYGGGGHDISATERVPAVVVAVAGLGIMRLAAGVEKVKNLVWADAAVINPKS